MDNRTQGLTPGEKKLFAILCEAATEGRRCPTNRELLYIHDCKVSIANLAHNGFCRIELYEKNWRVVIILCGEHAKKYTQLPPNYHSKMKPSRVIDKNGDTKPSKFYIAKPASKITLAPEPSWETRLSNIST